MACTSCKKKKGNNIKTLTSNVSNEEIKQAYEYVSIASKMDDSKWDYVERILNELYPGRNPLNRQCGDCLSAAAKLVEHLYHKRQIK